MVRPTEAELRRIALKCFDQIQHLDLMVFFQMPKPRPTDHILLRLQYKNDRSIKLLLRFSGGWEDYHEVNGIDSIESTLYYYNFFVPKQLEDFKKRNQPIPVKWKNYTDKFCFTRTSMQRFLNLK